jgi:hypothetical protein
VLDLVGSLVTGIRCAVNPIVLIRNVNSYAVLCSTAYLCSVAEFTVITLGIIWYVVDLVVALVTGIDGTRNAVVYDQCVRFTSAARACLTCLSTITVETVIADLILWCVHNFVQRFITVIIGTGDTIVRIRR